MKKLDFKNKVLELAIKRQQEIIDDFTRRINEISVSVMNINENQHDVDQKSLATSSSELINHLGDQLNFVTDEMILLQKIKRENKLHNKVSIGSVVKTDKLNFFPSVSVEKFRVDGTDFFGLSAKAPLFKAMKGKKVGERFSYQKKEYQILDVF